MRLPALFALLWAAMFAAASASAVTIDGSRDPAYGPALATQAVQTSYLDQTVYPGFDFEVAGSELDEVYGFIADSSLHVLLTGNLGFCCGHEFSHQETFDLYLDSTPGGQGTLLANNPAVDGLDLLGGLRFDTGFQPDFWFAADGGTFSVYHAELPSAGGGTGYWAGRCANDGLGTLTGGTNPGNIRAGVDNTNVAGVTHGCEAASGAGVTTGVEFVIPLALIGNPTGCVKACALLRNTRGVLAGNQVLGSLPVGSCALGSLTNVDFGAITGEQFFTVCASSTPTRSSTWGRLKVRYR